MHTCVIPHHAWSRSSILGQLLLLLTISQVVPPLTLPQGDPATSAAAALLSLRRCFQGSLITVPRHARWRAPEGSLLISAAQSSPADWIDLPPRLGGHVNGSGENSLEPGDTGSDVAAEFTARKFFFFFSSCDEKMRRAVNTSLCLKHVKIMHRSCWWNNVCIANTGASKIELWLLFFGISHSLIFIWIMSCLMSVSSLLIGPGVEIKDVDAWWTWQSCTPLTHDV